MSEEVMTGETMQAAVWHGPNDLLLEQCPIPQVVPGSILLKVEACGICGSDLRILKTGNPRITEPRIIGHEISGTVVEVGVGVEKFNVGDRISTGADVPCGKCVHCIAGRGNCCDINFAIGYQFDGGFADYVLFNKMVVDYGPIKKFGDDLSWEQAAVAEPFACCINGYEQALFEPHSGGDVVIFGAGPIGLMLMTIGRQFYDADHIYMIEPSAYRRELALSLGADIVIDPSHESPVDIIMELTSGQGVKAIFTACPDARTHAQAVKMVAKRGVVNLFGGLPKDAPAIEIFSNDLHYREAYITGSHGSTPENHALALELIENGQVNVTPLISGVHSLNEIHQAFKDATDGKSSKIIIRPTFK